LTLDAHAATEPVAPSLDLGPRPVPGGAAAAHLPVDADHWLCRCDGFLVDGSDGTVGVVEDMIFGSRRDRPDLLVVRRDGPHRLRTVDVPVESVVDVRPDDRRIVLRGSWHYG
jgi:hypothetical protein